MCALIPTVWWQNTESCIHLLAHTFNSETNIVFLTFTAGNAEF